MIQSGWVGRQNGRKLWSRGGCIYKIEIPIYRFFSVFFLRYSVFGIPTSVSVSVCWNTSVFGIGIGYRTRTSLKASLCIKVTKSSQIVTLKLRPYLMGLYVIKPPEIVTLKFLAQIQHVCTLSISARHTDLLQLLQFCPQSSLKKQKKTLPVETFPGLKIT